MPPARMRGDGRKAKNPKHTFLRLLGYLKRHIGVLILVVLCIFVNAYASITGSTALGKLVDNFILPMVAAGSTDFQPLLDFIITIACIFVLGMAASFLQSYLMVGVTQGIQKTVRDELFTNLCRQMSDNVLAQRDKFCILYINGEYLDEEYAYNEVQFTSGGTGTWVVPEGEVFVMGDNRFNSTDSRVGGVGTIDIDCILGRVLFRFLPFEKFGNVE